MPTTVLSLHFLWVVIVVIFSFRFFFLSVVQFNAFHCFQRIFEKKNHSRFCSKGECAQIVIITVPMYELYCPSKKEKRRKNNEEFYYEEIDARIKQMKEESVIRNDGAMCR